jgi:predicted ATPase/DNA-binding SARP family transcriptional activator/DNA-binding CsgD family transcriptional regulator
MSLSADSESVTRSEALRVWLLGGFRVSVGIRTIEENEWRLRKAASLVKLLALAAGNRLHREQIMYTLWPELGMSAASNNLRQTVHSARRTLDPIMGSRYLASQDESLVLCPENALWVDVDAFEEAARTARRSREPAIYRAARDLYTGELLPTDRYEEWAEEPRRRLQETYLSLLLGLTHLHEEFADYESAIETLRRVVSEEPTREEAYAGLMRLYALVGNNREALAQYGRLEEALFRALGTEPAASSRALREEIAAGRFPPTEGSFLPSPPEGPPDAAKHNLPASRSSFVGRETELRNIKRDLAMTRLLTLTGAGGCGKTRLALEVARELVGAYVDGVWLVELAPLSEGALVAQAVAAALGVQEQPDRSLTDTLVNHLRSKRTLLVLDNCEHLLDAVTRLADTFLNSCPDLRVLATSRESLNVEGELHWLVPSLSVPSLGQSPRVEELGGYESVRLFVERARHRNPAFSLTPENAQAVTRICGRLEGIPLAIELAAARVGLSVEQIAQRLDDSLRLLTTGSRTASPRQRTLRGTLDWSYALLSEPERNLFGRLSVFAGGFTLEAAQAVGADGSTDGSDVLDLLGRLVDKSLVVAEAQGAVRYKMLEPVRQYAMEKLEERGGTQAAMHAHTQYFLALTEEAEPELLGPRETQWYNRLEEEHDNIRAALSWSLEGANPELGLRLAGAIWWFWQRHGHLSEGLRWLDEGLARGGGASAVARAKALGGIGWLAYGQADLARMKECATEGLRLSTQARLGSHHRALFLEVLGEASWLEGDYERAAKLAERSVNLSREANDLGVLANSLIELGNASVWRVGGQGQARAFYEEALATSRELGSASILRSCLNGLGLSYLLQRNLGRAAQLFEESAALCREAGDRTLLPLPLNDLGWVALLSDDLERAEALHKESLALSKDLGGSHRAFVFLEGLACDAGAKGEAERAAKLFGAAQALREATGFSLEPAMRSLEEPYFLGARSQLEESAWTEAWEEGRTMSMETAFEYALCQEERPPPTFVPIPEQPPTETLTPREQEVALLVGRGLTNRQIAQELMISEHTVHHHVTNILKKLHLTSRRQVASRLSDW